MWHTFYTVSPYLNTAGAPYPRAVHFLMHDDGSSVRVVSEEYDGSTVVRFQGERYRPASSEPCAMADDLVGYAVAYVERPEEFARSPDDTEQVHAAWWEEHGDTLSCCTGDDVDGTE